MIIFQTEAPFRDGAGKVYRPSRICDFNFFSFKLYFWNTVTAAKTMHYIDRDPQELLRPPQWFTEMTPLLFKKSIWVSTIWSLDLCSWKTKIYGPFSPNAEKIAVDQVLVRFENISCRNLELSEIELYFACFWPTDVFGEDPLVFGPISNIQPIIDHAAT